MNMILETERLVIRHFEEKDAEYLLDYLREPRVDCFMGEQLADMEEARKFVAEKMTEEWCFAVCLKDSDRLIGHMWLEAEPSAIDKPDAKKDIFTPAWHYNKAYEGKGYAYEAAVAVIDWLFREKGCRRFYAYASDDNTRSCRLLTRLGMRLEGREKQSVTFVSNADGTPKYENSCKYAILKDEWMQQRIGKRLTSWENLTSLNGLRFKIDYGAFVYENYYPQEDTVVWKSLKGTSMTGFAQDVEVSEKVMSKNVAPGRFLVSWVEKSGLGVTQLLDFETGMIHSVIRNGDTLHTEEGKLTLLDWLSEY